MVSGWARDSMSSSSWILRPWLRLLNKPKANVSPVLSLPHRLVMIFSLAIDVSGSRVVAGGLPRSQVPESVLCFDGRTGRPIRSSPINTSDAVWYWICPDGRLLSLGVDGSIRLWNMEEGGRADLPPALNREPTSAATLSPEGILLRCPDATGPLELWDLVSGELLNRIEIGEPARWLVVGPGARRIVAGTSEGMLVLDGMEGRVVSRIPKGPDVRLSLCRVPVDVTPDGRKIVSAGMNGTLDIWNAETGQKTLTVSAHPGETSPHLDRWKKEAADDRARGRNVDVHSMALPAGVNALAITPCGRAVASGGEDGRIGIWDVTTGEDLGSLPGHARSVNAVAFTRDGTRLVSAGNDPFIRVWKNPLGPP